MKQRIDKILSGFLTFLVMIMALDLLWGVFSRHAMGSQASWSQELARFLLIWIGILGAAYASGQKMHLAIELLKPKLEKPNQERLEVFINMLIILFALTVMIIGGFRLVYITHTQGQLSPVLRIPMTVVYCIVPLSGLLVIYYKIVDLQKD